MAITREQLEFQIGANAKELVDALDKLKTKTIGLDGATDDLQGSMKDLSKTEKEYADAINKANASSVSGTKIFEDLNSTADQLNESMTATNTIIQAMNLPENELRTFDQALNAVTESVNLFKASITVFGSMKAAVDAVFNPPTIALANKLLYILQAYADIKGFDRLADSIETARNRLNLLAEAIDKFRFNASTGLMETIDRTSMLSKAFLVAQSAISTAISGIIAGFIALSGVSIFKTISKDGLDLGKIISGLGSTFRNTFAGIVENITKSGSAFVGMKLSIADWYKALSVAGLSLASFASHLADNEVAALAFVGTLNFTSAAFIALSLGIKIALHAIGSFIESIGDKLISAMDSFAEKFAKTQQVAVQFGFVIQNFGAAYGSAFIGTLSQWEEQIDSLAKTSIFSASDIKKATKIVVAENQALGMSYEENVKFLGRAVEIASSSGLELIDVVQRLQSALIGNSTAVAALGINLSSHAIEHSKLNQTMQKTIGTMTAQEKQQIALAEIYRQTEPLVGAAIKQGETIIGINQQIANSYGAMQSKIGSVNVFSIGLSKTYAGLLKTFESLPDAFFAVIGVMTDLIGVTFKIVGITIQWLLVIGGLHTAYKLLNLALATNIAFQTRANSIFQKLGLSLSLNVGQINSARTAFIALQTVLKGGFMVIMANVGHVLAGVTLKVWHFTTALLSNPLFLGGVAIAIGIGALIKALDELNKEFQIIQITLGDFQDISESLKDVFAALGNVLSGGFNVLVQSIKISILSLAELYHYAIIAGSALGKIFNPSASKEYDKRIDASLQKLDTLTASHEKSMDAIAMGFLGVNDKIALHAKYLDEAGKATDELAFKQLQLQKAAEAIDINTIRIDILGTEVEKLTNKYTVAAKEVDKFSKEILSSTEVNTEAVKSYQKALEDQAAAGFQLDKMRIDSLKGLSDIIKEVQKNSLKNNDDETKGIIAGFDDRREAVKEFEKAIAQLGPVSTEAASKIKAAYKAIETAQRMALSAAQKKREDEAIAETIKVLKEESEALKSIADRNRDISKAIAGERLTAQQKIMSDLQIELDSLDERLYMERASRGNNSEIVKALELQKILLVQNAEAQKRMADMELPDWIDQLGAALQKAFAFEAAKDFFSFIGDQVKKLQNSDIVLNIKQKITETRESLGAGAEGKVSSAMSSVGDAVMKAGEVAYAAGGALVSAVVKAGGWVGAFIDVIMNADKYLRVLIEFPKMFLNVLKNLPGLVKQFVDQFPGMIRAIAEALPTILIKLVDMIPSFIAAFLDALPLLIERLAEAIPEIFIKIVGMIPKIAFMIARAFFLAIQAFVKGLIRGIGRLLSGVKMPKVNIDTTETQKQFKKIAGTAGRLFSVKDLVEGVKDPMDKVMENIQDGFKKGSNFIKQAWQWVMDKIITPLLDGIMAVWTWVRDKILMPIWNALTSIVKAAFRYVELLWNALRSIVSTAFQFVADLWNGLSTIVATAFQFVLDIWNGLNGVVANAFGWIIDNVIKPMQSLGEKIAAPIVEAFKGISDFFKNIGEAFKSLFKLDFSGFAKSLGEAFNSVMGPIMSGFKKVMNGIIDFLNNIKIPGVEVGFSVLGKKVSFGWGEIDLLPGDIQRLAKGGLVGEGMPLTGMGTDTVPAMLTPGEFVMSKRGVNTAGLGMLQGINSGQMPTAGNTYNIQFEINVEAKTTMDEGFIRQQLIPKMRENLKRASLDGEFVLSSKGVRA
jgi:phage-related protein